MSGIDDDGGDESPEIRVPDLDLPQLDEIDIPEIDEYPPDASVLLHGPPGTGKTTVAGARISQLIRDFDYEVSDIVWATYRRALADDTLQRFAYWDVIDPEELSEPTRGATRYVSTLHAIANRAVGGNVDPVQPYHQREFCKDLGLQFSGGPPWIEQPGELLFQTFQWLANNCYDPGDPADVAAANPPSEDDLRRRWRGSIPDAWEKWEDYKEVRELIDFHEMISRAITAETPLPGRVFVVDEYHDAFPLFAKLCERWMYEAEIVVVAGDPHQVVNNFDGADPEFFNSLPFPKILLDTTYRVFEDEWQICAPLLARSERHEPPPVTRLSTGTVAHYNARKRSFDYVGKNASSATIGPWKTPAPNDENGPVEIALETGTGAGDPDAPGYGVDPNSVLFLARTRQQVSGIGAALERGGVLYRSQRKLAGWFDTKRKTTRRRLELFNAFQKLATFDTGGLAKGTSDGPSYGLRKWGSQPDEYEPPGELSLLPTEAAALLDHSRAEDHRTNRRRTDEIADAIRKGRHGKRIDHPELTEWVIPRFWKRYTAGAGSVKHLLKGDLSEGDQIALANALTRHAGCGPVAESDIGVQVLTIHASKGQEGDDVVLYAGIPGRVRKSMRRDPDERANEWRTWYVATSRASKRLHIVHGGFDWIDPLPNNALSAVPSAGTTNTSEVDEQ